MLLKLQDPRTHAWHYFDGITEIKVYQRSNHVLTTIKEPSDDLGRVAVMRVDTRGNLPPDVNPGKYEINPIDLILCSDHEAKDILDCDLPIRVAELKFTTGETKIVAWTGLAFLLNDQGQTVERL